MKVTQRSNTAEGSRTAGRSSTPDRSSTIVGAPVVSLRPGSVPPPVVGRDATQGWSMLGWIFQDWAVNAHRPDSRVVLILFRLGQWAVRRWNTVGRLISLVTQLISSIVFGVELPPACEIGTRLRLYHPHSIVINPGVRIGTDCHVRQNTTIGNVVDRRGVEKGNPVIGDFVELGAACVVLGSIELGDHVRVGALAAVTKSVPPWAVVVGNPARVIKIEASEMAGPS